MTAQQPQLLGSSAAGLYNPQQYNFNPQQQYNDNHHNMNLHHHNNNNNPYFYLVIQLQRRNLHDPWGLSLTWFHHRYLLVGGIKVATLAPHVKTSKGYWSPLDPRHVFWCNNTNSNNTTTTTTTHNHNVVPTFVQHLQTTCPVVHAQRLLPGDVIVALNDRSMSFGHHGGGGSCGDSDSMTQMTTFMKQTRQLTLVVLRNAAAVQQANSPIPTRSEDDLARRVVQCWVQRYGVPATAGKATMMASPTARTPKTATPPSTAMVRQVTPERQQQQQQHQSAASKQSLLSWNRTPTTTTAIYRNPLFQDENGQDLPYVDNESNNYYHISNYYNSNTTTTDPDEGRRHTLFLRSITTEEFPAWLQTRKAQWRNRYETTHSFHLVPSPSNNDDEHDLVWKDQPRTVAVDFWTPQGATSFPEWLQTRKREWRADYSWNRRKRTRIEQDVEQVVTLVVSSTTDGTGGNFDKWLRVRKNQWRVQRRKRQLVWQQRRQQLLQEQQKQENDKENGEATQQSENSDHTFQVVAPKPHAAPAAPATETFEVVAMDAVIQEQERKRRAAAFRRPPFDLTLLLDPHGRAPDDVVVHFLEFLLPLERLLLLRLDTTTKDQLTRRDQVWRSLCPAHWKLPRRPRKPWHLLYWTNLKTEIEQAKKRSDDLLIRAAQILFKGDQFQAIEKMVIKAEKDWGRDNFDINYSSGVVCERNSLLNLAVIHKRHKVVRWLVETKGADIESQDRGGFTPLLNAAWNGDRYLVRFFLCRGANRKHVGTCHYTKPLAAPDFEGRTAAGWAEHRGHAPIAKLIELGL